ncbi:MAG: hypothetical protein KIT09_06165 [Bryobacteraceae bacterium]|nr:hypothetical protein [Bryobacteraceae bacterium]
MIGQARLFWRFATGLRRFLRTPLSAADCHRIAGEDLRGRETNFLHLARRAIYGFSRSPYLPLLRWAGVEYGDLERLVSAGGVDHALEGLHDAGVYLDLEEFKGLRPITRPGLSIEAAASDFDNPLLAREFEVESGGSTGARRRMRIDFDLLVHDAASWLIGFEAQGVAFTPWAIWRAVPPGSAGFKHALFGAKVQWPLERWFSPTASSWSPGGWPFALSTAYAVRAASFWGSAIPAPEFVPLSDGLPVAQWLAGKVQAGTPGLLSAPASTCVRACIAAQDAGLDIAGSILRVSGEPFTEAKLRLIERLGAWTFSGWSMSEAGPLASGCARREAIDEVHVFTTKAALFQRPKRLAGGDEVEAIHLTTLLPSTPKVMLNVDTGDYGVLTRRDCGCLLQQAGFHHHLHSIRNYEKLTASGMHFLGGDVIRLVEQVLPAKYGGGPTDYQVVEEHDGPVNRVAVVVSPRLGEVNEEGVVRTVLDFLGRKNEGDRAMAAIWEQSDTLRVLRREPYVTPAAKTPALRVLRKGESS